MKKKLTGFVAALVMLAACLMKAAPAGAAAGDILWQFQRGTRIDASPAIRGDGTIYVGSDNGKLYAVDRDGVEIWQFAASGSITASPAIGTEGGFIHALDTDGKQRWRYAAGGGIASSPAIGPDGTLYVGSDDTFVYALEDNDSEASLRWRFRTNDSVRSSPVVSKDGTLYVGADNDHLHALSTDGTLKWRYRTGGDIRATPAIGTDGTVYVGSDDGYLYALTDADVEGRLKWRFKTGGPVRSSPALDSESLVYIGSDDGYLYAIRDNGTQGTLEWEFETAGAVQSSPGIGVDGTIYAGSFDGVLYALDAGGEEKWSVRLSEILSSPVIADDGTLYIGTREFVSAGVFQNGKLYAVETGSGGILHGAPWPMFRHDVRHTGRNTPNQAPQANAGDDQEADGGQRVTLDGSNSTDPDYGIAAYAWRQTAGGSVTISDGNEIRMSFVAPNIDSTEPLTFELTVTDNGGLRSTAEVSVSIEKDDSFCFINTVAKGFPPYTH